MELKTSLAVQIEFVKILWISKACSILGWSNKKLQQLDPKLCRYPIVRNCW